MKKISIIILALMFVFCGTVLGSKYEKAVPVLKDLIKGFEIFITGLDKANNVESLIKVMDTHSAHIKKIGPKVKEIMEKFPELKDENNHPEELKPYTAKMEELTKKLIPLFSKLQQYMEDPNFKKSFENWNKTMRVLDDDENKEEEGEDIED